MVTLSVRLGIPFRQLLAEDDATIATYLEYLDQLANPEE